MSNNIKGILWMVAMGFFNAINFSIVRILSDSFNVFQMVFISNLVGAVFIFLWLGKSKLYLVKTNRLKLYSLRSVLEMSGSALLFTAIAITPLPMVSAFGLITPLLIVVAAVIFLGEENNRHIWIAFCLGITGAIIITRPGVSGVNYGAILLLCNSLCFAICGIIIKLLTRTEAPLTITFYMMTLTTLVSLPFAIYFWVMPSIEQLVCLLALGAAFFSLQFSVSMAFSKADVTVILPFSFMNLVFTAFIAYFAFGELIDKWTIIGATVVLSSAVYAVRHEVRKHKSAKLSKE